MTMAARLAPVRASLTGIVGAEDLADLTWEQVAELRETITETVGQDPSPEELAAVVEATSPKLAKKFRSQSRQEVTGYANLVLVLFGLMLQIYSIVNAATPVQVTQIINHVESAIIVNPPPAPPAPAPTIRTPAAPPAAPPAQPNR